MACSNGDCVVWVCRDVALFTARKSTTRLGLPDFLPTTCIRDYQVLGVLDGTRSRTPNLMSSSNSALTCSAQCAGMVAGL